MCLKAPGWLWLPLVGYVLVHFDVWLALGWFTLCPGQVSICTRPARSPKSSKYSPSARTGPRSRNPTFNTSFGILRPSPALLEHSQALPRSNKRTIRGGGNGTCHAWFQDQSTFEKTNFFWRRPPWVAWVGKLKSQSQIAPWSLPSFRNPKN